MVVLVVEADLDRLLEGVGVVGLPDDLRCSAGGVLGHDLEALLQEIRGFPGGQRRLVEPDAQMLGHDASLARSASPPYAGPADHACPRSAVAEVQREVPRAYRDGVSASWGLATETPDPAEIEAAVRVVPGVSAAALVPGQPGQPEVLRVVLDDAVDAVDVARAAQRVMRLQFGVELEPGHVEVVDGAGPTGVIRLVEEDVAGNLLLGEEIEAVDVGALLAELDPGPGPRFRPEVLASAMRHPAGLALDDPAPESGASGRLAVAQLTLTADGLGVVVRVTLVQGGRERSGSAEAPPTSAAVHRAVASATLRALDGVLGAAVRLEVDGVTTAAVGDATVALVRVIWTTADGTEHLIGSSEVRGDPRQAVIRATLDAVNRRLFLDLADR